MRALGQLQATGWKELTARQQNLGIGLPVSGRLRTGTSIVAFASRLFTQGTPLSVAPVVTHWQHALFSSGSNADPQLRGLSYGGVDRRLLSLGLRFELLPQRDRQTD